MKIKPTTKEKALTALHRFAVEFGKLQEKADRLQLPRLRMLSIYAPLESAAVMGDGILYVNVLDMFPCWADVHPLKLPNVTIRDKAHTLAWDTEMRQVLWHEFGHHIHQLTRVRDARTIMKPPMEKDIKKEFDKIMELVKQKKRVPITEYSQTNYKEWFAENHRYWRAGKDVDPEFLKIIKKWKVIK